MRFATAYILAATSALAAPVLQQTSVESTSNLIPRGGAFDPDTSKCSGYQNAFWNIDQSVFSVTVGRPYLGGSRCGLVKDKVSEFFHTGGLTCKGANDNKNTVLTVKSNMNAENLANVNKGLKNAYPEINFDCPTDLQ